jgi:hypothetical protein
MVGKYLLQTLLGNSGFLTQPQGIDMSQINKDELKRLFPKASHDFFKSNEAANDPARDNRPVAKLERCVIDEPLAAPQVKEADSKGFIVRVTSVRQRLLDEDNLCEKYHVDGCRYSSLISSDAPGKTKILVGQRKVQKGEQEKTIIEITYI